ncbi:MAG: hypothetical protein FWC01_00135 [Treponema sp.]|nr:hypothetical protein [Treponema sp.]MCL2236672.1 hypothetical protein [Treponema sp.]
MKIRLVLLPAIAILLNSCLGVSLSIHLNRDGSGRLAMEYRISRTLMEMGQLDGNEAQAIIPAMRGEMESLAGGVPGARLASFSSRETAQDIIISANIEFANTDALAALLTTSSGENISISNNGQSGNIIMTVTNESEDYDADMMKLMRSAFDGYNFTISLDSYAPSSVSVSNREGASVSPSSASISQGRRSAFTMSMLELLEQSNGIRLNFSW